MDTLWILAFSSGVATHLLLYRSSEWDIKAPSIVKIYTLLGATLVYLERAGLLDGFLISTRPKWGISVILYHIAGVYASMLFYRAFWHRLCGFPGPFLARLSNFYVTSLSAKSLHLYEEVQKLHQQYGDYVRLALRDYEPRVSHYAEQLLEAVRKNVGKPMDMAKWFNYYSFDVMGDLSFGKSFNMLVGGQDTYFSTQLHADMKSIGLFSHLTWLFPFFKRIPILNSDYLKFWDWVGGRVEERIKNDPDRPDVFSWILDAFQNGPKTKQDHLDLHGDAYLIIVAGSDTTAATLTNLFFHLATDHTWQAKLQEELDALPELTQERLTSVKLLDALINETLRLHPAVPSGTQRLTPPEGLQIGDKYIPGDVMVCIPTHTLFRDERAFVRPNEFLPERWMTQPELIKDASVFIPFNAGPYSCVGKQLALMELRRVTAEILTRYDVEFAQGQTTEDFLDGKRDTFTLVTAPLKLVFRER
ncbi:cytochrome P450 [Aspergillus sergii]|uniref:Cytochrome P450 n=1 Tax=Aspergillus sergii TaxID=1034303 RepID=A0A5N6XFX9_9EURO|nr:cytochrome P450 [Aspergillus sergii]